MARTVLEVKKLSKSFKAGFFAKPVAAVRDLSFKINSGAAVAFVGPNGAGKTTTIYTILGLLKPSSGEVLVFDQSPRDSNVFRRIGFCPEIFPVYPFLTARQALMLYGELSGLSREKLPALIDQQLDLFGIKDAADRRMTTYSKGMVQRVGLAQALIHEPDLVILDEPTTGLDPGGRKQFVDMVANLKKANRTIFFSSHILSDVEKICDELVLIKGGELVLNSRISELKGSLEDVYLKMVGLNDQEST